MSATPTTSSGTGRDAISDDFIRCQDGLKGTRALLQRLLSPYAVQFSDPYPHSVIHTPFGLEQVYLTAPRNNGRPIAPFR